MAWFFKNPVLAVLEEKLFEKARKRYIDEGGDPYTDIKELNREARIFRVRVTFICYHCLFES